MAIFFTSDWHLGHQRIIELCNRPFASVEEMNREIIRRHNAVVSEEDTVFVLGDAVMGKLDDNLPLVGEMNGRLILILGNHDRPSPAYQHTGDRAAKVAGFLERYLEVFHEVAEEDPVIELDGLKVQLSHYPYAAEDERDQRYNELRVRDTGLPLVHGHVHNSWQIQGRELNVGVDVWDYTPVPASVITAWAAGLQAETV